MDLGLVERIRQDPSFDDIKIVVLTSGGEHGDAARCQKLGVAAYLSKPFDRLDLREVCSVFWREIPLHRKSQTWSLDIQSAKADALSLFLSPKTML